MLKIQKDGEDCWSVLASCDCGWHWMMTSMGPDAEKSANEWMNFEKILAKETTK